MSVPHAARKDAWGWALAAAVVVVPGTLTLLFRPPLDLGLDGAFYLHLARHVAQGDGFVTSVSLYHQALHPLPQASTVYPVWPLVLGLAARLTSVPFAGAVLPKALYVLDCWLAARVVATGLRRTSPGRDGALIQALPPAAGLLFALNPVLFWTTSMPYSEALAFALLATLLLAIDRAANEEPPARAALAAAASGVLAALLYLTRFQAILAPAVVAVVLAATARGAERLRRPLVALAAGAVPVTAAAWHILRVPGAKAAMLVDFAAYRQVPSLPPFEFVIRPPTLFGFFEDRMMGAFIAFDPRDPDSYYAAFGVLAYAPLAALAVGMLTPRTTLARVDGAVRDPSRAILVAALLLGGALLAPVHAAHEMHYRPWLFGFRHGLPFALPALTALVLMGRSHRRWVRVAALAFAAVAAAQGLDGIRAHLRSKPASLPGLQAAAAFLDARPGATAFATDPQSLSVHTNAGLYWVACWTARDVLPKVLERVPVTFVFVRPHEEACEAFLDVRSRLETPEALASGDILAYRIRRKP